MPTHRTICLLIGLAMLSSGCQPSAPVNALEQPTATAPVVDPQASTDTLFRPSFGSQNTPEPNDQQDSKTVDVTPMPTAIPTTQAPEYVEVFVYGDDIDPNWSLEESSGVAFDPLDTSYWYEKLDERLDLDSGAVSLAVTPLADFGTLFFTVKSGADVVYDRQNVLGVSMWINSGSAILDTSDLSVTVVGSNALSYWSADDYSAFPEADSSFSETRLYYLGLNRAIPPYTWAQIVVWLDDLQFDPLYSNVTGFYVKNDAGFNTTYNVDNVSLLMMP